MHYCSGRGYWKKSSGPIFFKTVSTSLGKIILGPCGKCGLSKPAPVLVVSFTPCPQDSLTPNLAPVAFLTSRPISLPCESAGIYTLQFRKSHFFPSHCRLSFSKPSSVAAAHLPLGKVCSPLCHLMAAQWTQRNVPSAMLTHLGGRLSGFEAHNSPSGSSVSDLGGKPLTLSCLCFPLEQLRKLLKFECYSKMMNMRYSIPTEFNWTYF